MATPSVTRGAILVAGALVLGSLAACAPQPTKPTEAGIPVTLYQRAEQSCLDYVGLELDAGDTWSYEQGRVTVASADGRIRATYFGGTAGSTPSASAVSCLRTLPSPVAAWPSRPDSRLRLVHYARSVLWPCLRARGYDPGDPPKISLFASKWGEAAVDPYIKPSSVTIPLADLLQLAQQCPAEPAYLPE